MAIAPVGEDDESTDGELNRYRVCVDGKQPGDPAKAAKATVDIIALDEPPLGRRQHLYRLRVPPQ